MPRLTLRRISITRPTRCRGRAAPGPASGTPRRSGRAALHLVAGDGDGEPAADPAVRAGTGARHDGHRRAGGHVVRAGARINWLVAGHRDELLVQLGDAEPERSAAQLQLQVMGVRRVDLAVREDGHGGPVIADHAAHDGPEVRPVAVDAVHHEVRVVLRAVVAGDSRAGGGRAGASHGRGAPGSGEDTRQHGGAEQGGRAVPEHVRLLDWSWIRRHGGAAAAHPRRG